MASCTVAWGNMKGLTRGFEWNGWRGGWRWNRDDCMWRAAIPECPCMYFGSDIIVSCLHADAAWMKMDVCVLVCPCWGSVSTDGCKTVAFLRTQRHLEGTFQGEDSHMNRAWQSEKLMAVCSPLTSWQSTDKRPSFKMWGVGQAMWEIRYGVSCLVRPKNIIYKWICRGLVDSRKRTPTCPMFGTSLTPDSQENDSEETFAWIKTCTNEDKKQTKVYPKHNHKSLSNYKIK